MVFRVNVPSGLRIRAGTLRRGHGLQTGCDLADQGLADAQDSSDLAVGFPLVQQFLDVFVLGLVVLLVGFGGGLYSDANSRKSKWT